MKSEETKIVSRKAPVFLLLVAVNAVALMVYTYVTQASGAVYVQNSFTPVRNARAWLRDTAGSVQAALGLGDEHERNLEVFRRRLEAERLAVLGAAGPPGTFIPPTNVTVVVDELRADYLNVSAAVPWIRMVMLYRSTRHALQGASVTPVADISSVRWRRSPIYPFYINKTACGKAEILPGGEICSHHTTLTPDSLSPTTFLQTGEYRRYFNFLSGVHVHVIPDALIMDGLFVQGSVVSRHVHFLPNMCRVRVDLPSVLSQNMSAFPLHDEVFALSQHWHIHFFHVNVEGVQRLMPYLRFLKDHPNIKIHVRFIRPSTMRLFEVLGLNRTRVIAGNVRARVAYLPQGGGCLHTANPLNLQLLSDAYLSYAGKMFNKMSQKAIVLIERTHNRQLIQRQEIAEFLNHTAQSLDMKFIIFSDKKTPGFDETIGVFHQAELVVAPHGAGLANLLWTPPPAAVVEVLCGGRHPNVCFPYLSQHLGHRHYAVRALTGCNGGLNVNVTQLKEVVQLAMAELQ